MLYKEAQKRCYELENSTKVELVGDEEHVGHLENCKDEVNTPIHSSCALKSWKCFLNVSSEFFNVKDGEEDSAE